MGCEEDFDVKVCSETIILTLGFTYIDVHSSVANWSSGQIFITSIQISLIIFLFYMLGFQKRIASICLKKYTGAICF